MYAGRIVAVGLASRPFVAYRVSSRSFPNREAAVENGVALIRPKKGSPDSKSDNPFISYNCIRKAGDAVVASNGTHTDEICKVIESGISPDQAILSALTSMGYERDDYSTPRIAAAFSGNRGYIGTVRKDGAELLSFLLKKGKCRFVATYGADRPSADINFTAPSAESAARFIFDGGDFKKLERPVCAAAYLGGLSTYSP